MDTRIDEGAFNERLTDALMMSLDKIALRELCSRLDPVAVELACARIEAKVSEAVNHRPEIAASVKPGLQLLLNYLREHAGKGDGLLDTEWGSLITRSGASGRH